MKRSRTQHTLAEVSEDALQKLVHQLHAGNYNPRNRLLQKPGLGSGELSSKNLVLTFAELLPVDAIVLYDIRSRNAGRSSLLP